MANTRKPIIGITGGNAKSPTGADIFQLGRAYLEAIHRAGGIPLMIPNDLDSMELNPILNKLDGVLFSGGGDIETARFKGRPHIKVSGVSPERDQLEFVLIKKVLNRHMPFLAICRGIQVLNVAFGGDLYTHIADQMAAPLKHDWYPNYPRDKHAHNVSLAQGSLLRDIFQEMEIPVNSLHHQGISRLGEGLTGVAFAPDGLVEGVEVKGEPFAVGVQWHPECLANDAPMQALFARFIAACQS